MPVSRTPASTRRSTRSSSRGRSKSPAPTSKSPSRLEKKGAGKDGKSKSMAQPPDEVLSIIGAVTSFTALHYVNLLFAAPLGYALFPCPPQGANTALTFFAVLGQPFASWHKKQINPLFSFVGMLIAGICGFAVLTLQSKLGYTEEQEAPWAKGAAVILAIVAMKKIMGTVHPPAASYAYMAVTSNLGAKGIIAPGPVGALVVGLVLYVWKEGIVRMGWAEKSGISSLK